MLTWLDRLALRLHLQLALLSACAACSGGQGAPDASVPDGSATVEPCERPSGVYVLQESGRSRSSDPALRCTSQASPWFEWRHVDALTSLSVGEVICYAKADVYQAAGCQYTSRIECDDGTSQELACAISTTADRVDCTTTTDYGASTCTGQAVYARDDGAAVPTDAGVDAQPLADAAVDSDASTNTGPCALEPTGLNVACLQLGGESTSLVTACSTLGPEGPRLDFRSSDGTTLRIQLSASASPGVLACEQTQAPTAGGSLWIEGADGGAFVQASASQDCSIVVDKVGMSLGNPIEGSFTGVIDTNPDTPVDGVFRTTLGANLFECL